MKRPSVNITPPERWGRVVLGLVAAVIGLVMLLLTSLGGPVGTVLEVLLVAAGLDMLVTGALGHCPLYAQFGRATIGVRRLA